MFLHDCHLLKGEIFFNSSKMTDALNVLNVINNIFTLSQRFCAGQKFKNVSSLILLIPFLQLFGICYIFCRLSWLVKTYLDKKSNPKKPPSPFFKKTSTF
jgi:hypothetical protein